MKILLAAGLTIAVLILISIRKLRVHIWKIMGAYCVMVIALFVFYNVRTMDLILPFYHFYNQMFYQSDFANTNEYPDALLPYLLEGKTIVVPKLITWDESKVETYDHWQSGGMLNMNLVNILRENGAEVIWDEYNFIMPRHFCDDITADIGYLNDTFRYSFFYNNLESEYGNAFYYYWFYGASSIPFKLMVVTDNIDNTDKLYLLFDKDSNMYLVSEEFYSREVASLE